ncbi:hypothetical protein EON65_35200 [archaeon]|nr:MAG: hypothetical protein EON65_35200 [archaeon]
MSEVSRENFREFMHNQIEMELPWDKFDAAMQRIDANKSGFITSHEVFSAFLKLTPLSDRLKPPLGQQVTQLLLTICNDGLVQYHHKIQTQKKDKMTVSTAAESTLSQTWLHLLLGRQGSSASFQRYLDTLYSNANGDKAARESTSILSFMSEKELRLYLESKWVEDQLFVSDILFELSREFVNKAHCVIMDQPQNKQYFSKNKVSAALEYIIKNQQEACSIVAKSLNFYNNLYRNMTSDSGRDVLQELSNFVLDFTEYRARILEYTIRNTNISLNEEMINMLHRKSQQLEQWLLVAVDHPTKLYHEDKATGSLDIKIIEDWRIAELMSVFIPYPSQPEKDASDIAMPCFSSVQSLLELCLVQSVDGMEKYVTETQHKYAAADALHEVQEEIHKSLWQHNTLTVNSSALKNTKVPLAGHLVNTINAFNHQQRVDQVTQYLELLNHRAISKKKTLQILIQLWNSTKSFISPASPGKPRRPTASREEIVVQTRTLQDRLLEDMQHKPHVKQEQLERRVQNLITAVFSVDRKTNEKMDIETINRTMMSVLGGTELVDEALVDSLIEVQSLQESLLQANNDAMRLSARILQALKL